MASRLFLCLVFVTAIPAIFSSIFGGGSYDEDELEDYDDTADYVPNKWTSPPPVPSRPDVCVPVPLGGVDWILSVRRRDFGWKGDTHRAVIALALNRWGRSTEEEIKQMQMQLEVELTTDLLQNGTSAMHPNDLALYIHALIAIQRNPHNFYGVDLVSKLEKVVDSSPHHAHPFLLLALCNAKRFSPHHLHRAHSTLQKEKASNNIDSIALALNAYECAGTIEHQIDEKLITEVRNKLIDQQNSDGGFGNVYKTSLVVLALASKSWSNRHSAIEYLKKHSTIDVNMISTYLIQLALNAEKVHFIKDLYPDLKLAPVTVEHRDNDPFIQYTLRRQPDVYFTITIRVSPNMTFFDVMKLSAEHDAKFNFSYFYDKENNPNVYSISGVPNDAEENLYWRLCLQTDINHNRHDYRMETIRASPKAFVPRRDQHVIYWYKNTDCEIM